MSGITYWAGLVGIFAIAFVTGKFMDRHQAPAHALIPVVKEPAEIYGDDT